MQQYLTKKIGDSYVAWFEKSNSWIKLEEPAWYVSKLFHSGLDHDTISSKCAKKYQLKESLCIDFVKDVCHKIDKFSKGDSVDSEVISPLESFQRISFTPYTTRYYLIGGKRFIIEYNSRLAEYYIHPPLAHLEIKDIQGIADEKYKIVSQVDTKILMQSIQKKEAYVFDDFIRLKKRLFIDMVNIIYNKSKNDWLSFVHAAAVTDGKNTILLSSTSGSGKSTMAALLQTKGLGVVSDDFVPIDVKSKRAFPFQAAISIKQGSFSKLSPFYGDLHQASYNSYFYSHKSVRYLAPKETDTQNLKPKPVKSLLFLQYNQKVECNFRQVPVVEALAMFHEQAWVSSQPDHAKTFINWFAKLPCYQLEYGDAEVGIETVLGLFKDC